MRDNFTQKTKDILAKRVAFRCSFRGCGRITICSGHADSSDIINVGEAAHIHAASPNGPRYDENMTTDERISIDNGIWMCRQHAKLIDGDKFNYSAETLKQWKTLAEEEVYQIVKDLNKDSISIPTTLVALNGNIVFEGIWKGANNGEWIFVIDSFVLGSIQKIIEFHNPDNDNYIIIESQGDGRAINGNVNWEIISDKYQIALKPEDKTKRTTPYDLAGLSADFEIENGDIKLLKGEAYAKQVIELTLSSNFGEWRFSPTIGSFFSSYYWKFKENPFLLKRLLKIEIIRLISIPHEDKLMNDNSPLLNFINRVIDIDIPDFELKDQRLPVKIKLEWGDGKHWEDTINIYIKPKQGSSV